MQTSGQMGKGAGRGTRGRGGGRGAEGVRVAVWMKEALSEEMAGDRAFGFCPTFAEDILSYGLIKLSKQEGKMSQSRNEQLYRTKVVI